MSAPREVALVTMIDQYLERQVGAPSDVMERLVLIEHQREVEGWMLLECAQFDSSYFAQYTLLPYGPGCTFKVPPEHPVSPRGLASDMSVVVAIARKAA